MRPDEAGVGCLDIWHLNQGIEKKDVKGRIAESQSRFRFSAAGHAKVLHSLRNQ